MIAGRWFVTPHAVRQYIARVHPGIGYDRGLQELQDASWQARFVKRVHGAEIWRTGKPRRLRLIVGHGEGRLPALITVLPGGPRSCARHVVPGRMDLCHYTLNTGDIRRSPRSEVAGDIIVLVRPWCAAGDHALPAAFAGYWLRTSCPEPGTLAATLHRDSMPIVVWSCCRTRDALAAAYARLVETGLARPGADVWAPACLVTVLPAFLPAESWAGDLERCLAWAWAELP